MELRPYNPSGVVRAIEALLLFGAGVFLVLHAVHLTADFPNFSPWMDWSKYTDEGWYGDGAIRHFQRGHWNLPGDFNAAAALPVWPFLEALVFHFSGVSLAAARALTVAVFGLILLVSYGLLRRHLVSSGPLASLVPAAAVLLLGVSPFCFVFTRLAILEPLLILLTLLALLAASYASPRQGSAGLRYFLPLVLLGVLLPLMVLTKTTAVFLFPAIAWMLYARAGCRLRAFVHLSLVPAGLGAVLWFVYYGLLIRPHYLTDYRYLFAANAYTGITAATVFSILQNTFTDGMWIGPLLYPLAVLAALVALLRLRGNPLVVALLLWAAGYGAFLAYHNNLQPRYYLVIAVPLTLLTPLVLFSVWPVTRFRPILAGAAIAALALVALVDARHTLSYVRHPEYTYVDAADQIRQVIAAQPDRSPLVLSISGSNLSLMTGLPSICDDFGSMALADRIRTYKPGWYVAWNQVEDDKMEALAPLYHLQRVAAFPAMDDPIRNLLIVYRLDPPLPGPPRSARSRRTIPRALRTKIGQQPSVVQLEH